MLLKPIINTNADGVHIIVEHVTTVKCQHVNSRNTGENIIKTNVFETGSNVPFLTNVMTTRTNFEFVCNMNHSLSVLETYQKHTIMKTITIVLHSRILNIATGVLSTFNGKFVHKTIFKIDINENDLNTAINTFNYVLVGCDNMYSIFNN